MPLPAGSPDPVFTCLVDKFREDPSGQLAAQFLAERGKEITSGVLANPANDLGGIEPIYIVLALRPILGPKVFTPHVLDRLRQLKHADLTEDLISLLPLEDASYQRKLVALVSSEGTSKEIESGTAAVVASVGA